jgi:hypothetical protein
MSVAGYEIVRLLGEGGMGRVYEAVHRPTGRRVALKRLRTRDMDASMRRALLDEATASAQLDHRNVVRLLDVELDEGRPMLVMELVEGTDLGRWVRTWPGWSAVQSALLQTLDALSEAHAKRIVHGDLKPANLLRAVDGTIKVADFGVAHVLDPLRSAAKRGPAGTPVYMAPEQFDTNGLVGPWTDLYALGVMIAELVCGHEPFVAETLQGLLLAKGEGAPELAPRDGLRPSEGFVALVRELLRPDPRARPRFARDVRDLLAGGDCTVSEMDLETTVTDLPSAATMFVGDATQLDGVTGTMRVSSAPRPADSSTEDLRTTLPSRSAVGPGASVARLRAVPLVERDAELAALVDAMTAVRRGASRAVLLTGPLGAGKSRLARHLFEQVEREGLMESVAIVYDTSGAGVVGGLRSGLRRLLGAPSVQRAGDVTAWAWLDDGKVDLAAVARWLGPTAEPLPLERSTALAHALLRAAGTVRPVYLWIDEIEAARDGAAQLVERLLGAGDANVLVVATGASGAPGLPEHPELATLDLAPIGAAGRIALLRAFGLSPHLAAALAMRIDEAPAALAARVDAWLGADLLVAGIGGWEVRPGLRLEALAEDRWHVGAEARVNELLSAVGTAGVRVLACAALLGQRFEAETLRIAVDPATVDAALDRALVEGVLRAEGQRTYAFDHASVHQQLLAHAAGLAVVNELRVATARALLAAHGNGNPAALERAAMLLRDARDPSMMTTLREAVRAYDHAADFQGSRRLIALARAWLDDDGVAEDDPARAGLEHTEGFSEYHQMRYERAREHLQRAIDLYRRAGDTIGAVEASCVLESADFYQGRLADAERAARERLTMSGDGPRWQRMRLASRHRLAQLAGYRGDLTTAEAELRACADVAARDDAWGIAVRAELAEAMALRGKGEEAATLVAAAAETCASAGAWAVEKEVALGAARVDVIRGRHGAARAPLEALARFFEAQGDRWRATATLAFLAVVSAVSDDLPTAEIAVTAFLESYRAVAHDEATTWWAMDRLAEVLRERGATQLAGDIAEAVATTRASMLRALSGSG